MTKVIGLLGLVLVGTFASAQVVVPGDDPYWTQELGSIQVIYPAEHLGAMPELVHYLTYFKDKYEKSYNWVLDEKLKLILTSSRNQIANGFATVVPFLETVHFPTGSELLDQFAEDSFLLALNSHETAHLYQLSAKSRLSSWVRRVLGNTPFILTPFVVPVFVFPNAFLPNFVPEGNAVLNESITGAGGRLWSGEVLAEVLAQIRAGEATTARLINSTLEFPLQEPYHLGGYFFGHLGEEFGIDRTNQFFVAHAEREFWPFNINKTFRGHFGKSYTRILHDLKRELGPLADHHQPAQGEVVARVFTRPTFNHDGGSVFFVANPTGRGPNRFFRVHKKDGKIEEQKTGLDLGKVFLVRDQWLSVSAQAISPSEIRYALFDESLFPLPETENQIYQDVRAGHTLTMDATKSYARNQLLKDGQLLDQAGSSAILDDQGRAYYFRQSGADKILYRDREALFKFQGYYGFPVEVGTEGEIYFIATTTYGSSLFRWHKGTLERVLKADNVVQARCLGPDLFLIAAITAEGYEIQKIRSAPKPGTPALHPWKFPAQPLPVPAAQNLEFNHAASDPYTPLGQLRFSAANVALAGTGGIAELLFTDPLLWNALVARYSHFQQDETGALAYVHQRYRLGWMLAVEHEDDFREDLNGREHHRVETTALLGLQWAWARFGRWEGNLALSPLWTRDTLRREAEEENAGALGQIELIYDRRDYGLAYDSYRHFALEFLHRTEMDKNLKAKTDSINGVNLTLSGDVFRQTYLTAHGGWAVAEQDSVDVDYLDLRRLRTNVNVPIFSGDGEAYDVREWSVTLQQAIDQSWYASRFPLSLRRWAPFATLQEVYTRERGFNFLPDRRQDLQLGVELESLFFHKIPLRLTFIFDNIRTDGGAYARDDLFFFRLSL